MRLHSALTGLLLALLLAAGLGTACGGGLGGDELPEEISGSHREDILETLQAFSRG